jgi:tRNA(fMet)-specific endonuclease VapC
MYFLDTNTCIHYLTGKYASVRTRILATPPNEMAIPSIVKAELFLGAYKSRDRKGNTEKVERFLAVFGIAAFDDLATCVYSEVP